MANYAKEMSVCVLTEHRDQKGASYATVAKDAEVVEPKP